MAIAVTFALRAVQAVFTIIVLGLTAYVANWWNGYWHDSSPSEINFLIFASSWTILSLAFLCVVPWKFRDSTVGHKYAILGAEAITMIFWLAGFIALAVFLSNRVCFGHVCNIAKAAVVFASLEWALFVATTVMTTLQVVRGPSHRINRTNPTAPTAAPTVNNKEFA